MNNKKLNILNDMNKEYKLTKYKTKRST